MNLQEQIEKKAEEYAKFYEEDRTKIEYIAMDFKVGANFILDKLRWRSIEKELPETNTDNEFDLKGGWSKNVIAKCSKGNIYIANYSNTGKSWNIKQAGYHKPITHWRPILEIE